jgi:hypothetical protein
LNVFIVFLGDGGEAWIGFKRPAWHVEAEVMLRTLIIVLLRWEAWSWVCFYQTHSSSKPGQEPAVKAGNGPASSTQTKHCWFRIHRDHRVEALKNCVKSQAW